MGVGPTARSSQKIPGGLRIYIKGVDHKKGGGSARKGGCEMVPSYDRTIKATGHVHKYEHTFWLFCDIGTDII